MEGFYPPMPKLGIIKYTEWEKEMFVRLTSFGGYRIVTGEEIRPQNSSDPIFIESYKLRRDRAAEGIYLALDEGNKLHVDAIRDDPAAMWAKLKEIHSRLVPKGPAARISALCDLADIRLRDGESLTQLCTRVEGAMQRIKASRRPPTTDSAGISTPTYTIEMLDDDLTIMAMLRALPREEYAPFISSVLMLSVLTKDAVIDAFQTEEIKRSAAAVARIIKCYLCDAEHKIKDCPFLQSARTYVEKDDGNFRSKKRGGRRGANSAANSTNTPKV